MFETHRKGFIHLFRDCSVTSGFWRGLLQDDERTEFFNMEGQRWFSNNLNGTLSLVLSVDWSRFFASALWGIWRMRNDWVFSRSEPSVTRIWGFIRAMGMEQEVSRFVAWSSSMPGEHRNTFDGSQGRLTTGCWVKPATWWIKVNMHGAVTGSLFACCGGIRRCDEGQWFIGFCKNLGDCAYGNSFLAQLMAISTAVEVVMDLDILQVIIESDSL